MPLVVEDSRIRIVRLDVGGGMVSNAYMLVCRPTGESVVVDAPGDAGRIAAQLGGTTPRYILITHNHFDHLGALAGLKARLGVPVAAHPADRLPIEPDILLADGDTVTFGRVSLQVFHTPGHTPGSLCFYTEGFLISGDTLFPGGPGRTSSPAALARIIESITTRLLPLPDETRVFPGHGEPTVLKKERAEIEHFKSRPYDPGLCGDVLWLQS